MDVDEQSHGIQTRWSVLAVLAFWAVTAWHLWLQLVAPNGNGLAKRLKEWLTVAALTAALIGGVATWIIRAGEYDGLPEKQAATEAELRNLQRKVHRDSLRLDLYICDLAGVPHYRCPSWHREGRPQQVCWKCATDAIPWTRVVADFEKAVSVVLKHEGVDSDHPNDTGGRTRFGISQAAYPDLDISALTLNDAKALYRLDYWTPLRAREIRDQRIADYVMDVGVNHGVTRAALMLQDACNYLGSELARDGRVGPKTLQATNGHDPTDLLKVLTACRASEFLRLVKVRHGNKSFAKGWMRRAFFPWKPK